MSTSTDVPTLSSNDILRMHIETFLFHEAELLDEWRLDEWLTLLDENAISEVPSTDLPEGDSAVDQMLVSDSYAQIVARVKRLKSKNAHAENPRSRTRRLLTNVRVRPLGEGAVAVRANFTVHRIKYGITSTFIGEYRHVLVQSDGQFRFRLRRAVLDLEALSVDGRISIIL